MGFNSGFKGLSTTDLHNI